MAWWEVIDVTKTEGYFEKFDNTYILKRLEYR